MPARTSAARRRRCWSRWRAGAACRGYARRIPPSAATSAARRSIHNVETLAHVPCDRARRRWWRSEARRRAPALVGVGGGRAPGLLRGAERDHRPRADRRVRAAARRGARRDRARRRSERHPAARGARRPADPRGPARVGLQAPARPAVQVFPASYPPLRLLWPRRCGSSPRSRARSARRAGSATARCTSARGARRRPRGDDARAGRGVARRDAGDLDLRPRPGVRRSPSAVPCALAGALRGAGEPAVR